KPHPAPTKSWAIAQPPIITVGQPGGRIGAPQADMSPTRSAGRPWISTVIEPFGNGAGGCGPAGGGIEQVCRSPTTAAGRLPMSTVATPGPVTTPGWGVRSLTRAAGGMAALPQLILTTAPLTVIAPLALTSVVAWPWSL